MAKRFHTGPLVAVVAIAASGLAVWHFYPRPPVAPVATPAPVAPPAAAAPVAGAPLVEQHPIEQVPVPPAEDLGPLPTLDDSDGQLLAAFTELLGSDAGQWLAKEFLVPRLVATVDGLPRRSLTRQVYAAQPLPGTLATADADGRLWLDASNARRYDAAVAAFEKVDLRQAVAVYVRFYPLFQRAYTDLGTGERGFNDRVVAVIDHLLAAPEVTGPLELHPAADGRPRLEFADPQREAQSVGHKLMWRLGPDHAARVKARLRELRTLLVAQRPTA